MRMAFIEPFSGASGDMLLGALFDAGLELDQLLAELHKLHLPEVEITVQRTSQQGISGMHAEVKPETGHHARAWRDIRQMIQQSSLDPVDRATAIEVFTNLAEAEAAVHNESVENVHFHEVGALDTIIDIVGCVVGLRLLDVEHVYSAPVHVGGGNVRAAHGLMPVPAPATALLLSRFSMPLAEPFENEATAGELLTPTGAALLGTLARFERPAFTPQIVGSGFGTKHFPWPNMVRITIGNLSQPRSSLPVDRMIVLDTNIDDMNPQFLELLVERLFAADSDEKEPTGADDLGTGATSRPGCDRQCADRAKHHIGRSRYALRPHRRRSGIPDVHDQMGGCSDKTQDLERTGARYRAGV
jgi:uncharacterized protein (TIGR00299 family) protein